MSERFGLTLVTLKKFGDSMNSLKGSMLDSPHHAGLVLTGKRAWFLAWFMLDSPIKTSLSLSKTPMPSSVISSYYRSNHTALHDRTAIALVTRRRLHTEASQNTERRCRFESANSDRECKAEVRRPGLVQWPMTADTVLVAGVHCFSIFVL